MADPLGATASIVAVLQLATAVVKYVNAAAGAPKQRKDLRDGIRSCEFVVNQLRDETEDIDEAALWANTMKVLGEPGGPLERLKAILGALEQKLAPKTGSGKSRGRDKVAIFRKGCMMN